MTVAQRWFYLYGLIKVGHCLFNMSKKFSEHGTAHEPRAMPWIQSNELVQIGKGLLAIAGRTPLLESIASHEVITSTVWVAAACVLGNAVIKHTNCLREIRVG